MGGEVDVMVKKHYVGLTGEEQGEPPKATGRKSGTCTSAASVSWKGRGVATRPRTPASYLAICQPGDKITLTTPPSRRPSLR